MRTQARMGGTGETWLSEVRWFFMAFYVFKNVTLCSNCISGAAVRLSGNLLDFL
jgi:hypothetical protein